MDVMRFFASHKETERRSEAMEKIRSTEKKMSRRMCLSHRRQDSS